MTVLDTLIMAATHLAAIVPADIPNPDHRACLAALTQTWHDLAATRRPPRPRVSGRGHGVPRRAPVIPGVRRGPSRPLPRGSIALVNTGDP